MAADNDASARCRSPPSSRCFNDALKDLEDAEAEDNQNIRRSKTARLNAESPPANSPSPSRVGNAQVGGSNASSSSTGGVHDAQIQLLLTTMEEQQATMNSLLRAFASRQVEEPPQPSTDDDAKDTELPAELSKQLHRLKKSFVDTVRKFMKSRKRAEECSSIVQALSESNDKYPPGVKPFHACPTLLQLDEPWSMTNGSSYTFTFQIEAGASRRNAMGAAHRAVTTFMKAVECEALDTHRDACKINATKASLRASIEALVNSSNEKNYAEDLDIDDSLRKPVSLNIIDSYAASIFSNAVVVLTKEKQAHDERAKKAASEKENTRKELLKSDPPKLFAMAVRQGVKEELVEQGLVNPDMDVENPGEVATGDTNATNDQHAPLFVESMCSRAQPKPKAKPKAKANAKSDGTGLAPKNGVSPSAGSGHNRHSRRQPNANKGSKGKGKGKVAHGTMGKGKGKRGTKGDAKGAGTGKSGKGKGGRH